MHKPSRTRLIRGLFLERDIERLRQQLARFQRLTDRRPPPSLADFDTTTERLISRVFGETSELLEAYAYAKLGEAGSLVNVPAEAQESGGRDVRHESLRQRRRVLQSCIAELETLRGARSGHKRVADYMSDTIRSIHLDAPIKEAGRLLQKWKVGSLLVDDGQRYIGIITDTDLSRRAVGRGLDPAVTRVRSCMTRPIISIEDSEPVSAAVALMKARGIRHLAVTEDQSIIGVLSISDVLRYYADLVPTLRNLAGLTPEEVSLDGAG